MSGLPKQAAIALGSNVGDRLAHIRAGIAAISALPGTRVLKLSSTIETPALIAPGAEPQSDFLNAAVLIETLAEPTELLQSLLEVEKRNGRDRSDSTRWRPRTLDLDLIWFEDCVCQTPRLTLPHPELHARRFVLEPLSQVSPEWVHPTSGLNVAAMLEALTTSTPSSKSSQSR